MTNDLFLISFLDHLSGKNKPYKTVSARATEDSKVIKLPFGAFKVAFEKYPDAYLRVVQVVMIRLQRVSRHPPQCPYLGR